MQASRFCRFCKKVFCCTECRDRHANNVHPDLNVQCVLCSSEILPMRQFDKLSLDNEKLLHHITDKHLPLHCVLCGELFETEEDLKSLGTCKYYSEHHPFLSCGKLALPTTPALKDLEAKLKQHCASDDNFSVKTFFTPPEIYRQTSTPMSAEQKNEFEYQTPSLPYFSLKTPKTNSLSVVRDNATLKIHESQDSVKFFSFSAHTLGSEETTPFRTGNEQFPRNSSSRKLNIKEEAEYEIAGYERVTLYDDRVASPTDKNLTDVEQHRQDSPKLNVMGEKSDEASNVVKKVRFSNRHEPEFQDQVKSCAKIALNMTEEEFHDARDISIVKNTTDTKEHITEDIDNGEDAENAKDETKDRERSVVDVTKNFSELPEKKENVKREDQSTARSSNGLSSVNQQQQGTSRVLMMVLLENNSGDLSADLIPLINSGLKKLQEQAELAFPNTAESSNVARNADSYAKRSLTKVEMSVSSVDSYTNRNMMTNHRRIIPSSSSISSSSSSSSSSSMSMKNGESSSNGGILSAVTQAFKFAFRNLSGRGASSSNAETAQIIQRREIEGSTSLTRSSVCSISPKFSSNLENRPGKRARDITETSSWMDPIASPLDTRSPLPKRQRGWYKIKARQPIRRMHNNVNRVTSPRGVSSGTQIFSQGSLTAGDTVLPLPARAHQFTQTE